MSFKRLVRFVSNDSKIYVGEAILGPNQHDARFAKEAYIINGDIFSGNSSITKETKPITKLLSPISPQQINTIRLLGMNYIKHANELGTPIPKFPVIFYKPKTAVTNPTDPIIVPKFAQVQENGATRVDYESELVVVIGKKGKDIPLDQALDHVLGYTIGNDVSQRTWQITRGGSQFSTGKMFDTWAPLGPALVSPSVITDPNGNLKIQSVVNGELRQDSETNDMIFNVKQTIHFLSQGTTLLPGDVIFTGTPSGVAAGVKSGPAKWLKHGDEVICKIDKIGSIANPVQFEKNGFRDFKL